MPQPYIETVIRSLAEQGCRIRRTKAGVFVYCPDGEHTLGFHTSKASDKRTMKNLKASVIRAGLQWPKGVPA